MLGEGLFPNVNVGGETSREEPGKEAGDACFSKGMGRACRPFCSALVNCPGCVYNIHIALGRGCRRHARGSGRIQGKPWPAGAGGGAPEEVSLASASDMADTEKMLIAGGTPLMGETRVSGGKNTSVAVIPAALLASQPCTIENLPDIEDVNALVHILRALGARVTWEPGSFMTIDPRPAEGRYVSYRHAQRLRASYYLLGALLGRGGKAEVAYPGGCEIG